METLQVSEEFLPYMDWLKDKKNQPIVAIIAAVVIVGIAAAMYFFVFKPKSAAPTDMSAADPSMDMSAQPMDPNAPPAGGAPAPAPAPADASKAQVKAMPMENWRKDPFQPVGYKAPATNKVKRQPPIPDFPFYKFPSPIKKNADKIFEEQTEPAQPVRRMSGILLNERIYAIIESEGKTEIVQPGDLLDDRLATVEKIEKDKVILKTTTKNPRYLVIRMAAAPRTDIQQSAAPSQFSPEMPGGFPMPPGGRSFPKRARPMD